MYPIKGGGGGGGAKGRQGEGDDNRRAHAAGKTVSDNVNTGGPPYWNIAPPPAGQSEPLEERSSSALYNYPFSTAFNYRMLLFINRFQFIKHWALFKKSLHYQFVCFLCVLS